ncbi:MAG: DM13 domain-containing protein [Myxococcales bacterium]|nr:DM13 domain-containing protein [Myxococcales bacterium]
MFTKIGIFSVLSTPILLAIGCAETGSPGGGTGVSGEALYSEPVADGNSYACATCHAISEPASDGFRRPGHPLGDATRRPSYKDGQVADMREAVNSCLTEWMSADPWTETDPRWIALFEYLDGQATVDTAPAVDIDIVAPPANLDGGDETSGRETFNASCAVCHGQDAEGTTRAPSLTGTDLTAAKIAERIRLSGRADSEVYDGLTGGVMPFWGKNRLSEDELLDVVAYAYELGQEERQTMNDAGLPMGDGGGDCASTHPDVGKKAVLSTKSHKVAGTATIVDDCTIRIDGFTYDAGGIDVRLYGGKGGDYDPPTGFPISNNLVGTAFDNETVTFTLPDGKTFDDLDGISVWCVDVSVSFGDGLFN